MLTIQYLCFVHLPVCVIVVGFLVFFQTVASADSPADTTPAEHSTHLEQLSHRSRHVNEPAR